MFVDKQFKKMYKSEESLHKLTSAVFLKQIQESREDAGSSILHFAFNKSRCRILTKNDSVKENSSGILYWMCRECRVQDNWPFLFAQRLALKNAVPLHVCFFCGDCPQLYPTRRQFKFLIDGLELLQKECKELSINFHLLNTSPLELVDIVKSNNIGAVVCDFFPLRIIKEWKESIVENLPGDVPLVEVDGHNIVPCWVASEKQEIGARTLRPKINKQLSDFLTEFPRLIAHPHPGKLLKVPNLIKQYREIVESFPRQQVKEVSWAKAGSDAALETLRTFITERLGMYSEFKNDASKDALSNLSPWLHFGHISAQRCALEMSRIKDLYKKQIENFLEELIIRKELADNFCFYNAEYDNLKGASGWAQDTLNAHRKDKRPYIYTKQQFEEGKTHDSIWNTIQVQLLHDAKIHGYMRMYWCKKILEWTQTPEEALEIGFYLNDTYSLDGSDPNGFVGVMWSICGVHDQGWKERDVFGKIRYMVDYCLVKKFDVKSYCSKYGLEFEVPRKKARKTK